MAELSGADSGSGVIEIGPGVGVLTVELAKRAKRVVAVELDKRLIPVLEENLRDYENAEVVQGDVMKLDLPSLIKEKFLDCSSVCVCANLPYYITSPIIMMLLEQQLGLSSITVMVQREAAERMCAQVGSRASGAVTVAVRYYSEPQMLFKVSPGSFLPPPKVESAVMRLDLREINKPAGFDETVFRRMVKDGFAQRRKTFVNSVSGSGRFSKEQVTEALKSLNIDSNVRIEQLNMDQLMELSAELSAIS